MQLSPYQAGLAGQYLLRLRVLPAFPAGCCCWELKTGKETAPLQGHVKWARCSAFTPDSKTLVTGGNDPFLLIRDWPSGEVRKRVEHGRGTVQELFVSEDGRYVDVKFWSEMALARYDLETGKPVDRPADTHRAEVLALVARADGSLLTLGGDSMLRRWDLSSGRQISAVPVEVDSSKESLTLTPEGKRFKASSFSADGRFRVSAGARSRTLTVWDARTEKKVPSIPANPGGWWAQTAAAFSPEGDFLATTEKDQVNFWTVGDWRLRGTIPTATSSLDFSPDGRMLVTADLNDVTVWELATQQIRFQHRPGVQLPTQARFSPNNRFLAWAMPSGAVEVWDLTRNRLIATFKGHDAALRGFTFTSDSTRLVTASDDCTLLVWDVVGAADRWPQPVPADDKEVRAAWDDLASADARRAFAGLQVLAAAPDQSIPLVRDILRPVAPVDTANVDKLLANLDSDDFATREKATADLLAVGDQAETRIRAFLAGNPPLEAHRRAEQILSALTSPSTSASRLREYRALEMLERAGTSAARELLRDLANGRRAPVGPGTQPLPCGGSERGSDPQEMRDETRPSSFILHPLRGCEPIHAGERRGVSPPVLDRNHRRANAAPLACRFLHNLSLLPNCP